MGVLEAIGIITGAAALGGTAATLTSALKKPKKQPQIRRDPIDDSLPSTQGQAVSQLPSVTIPQTPQMPIIGGNVSPAVIPSGQQQNGSIIAALQQLSNQRIA